VRRRDFIIVGGGAAAAFPLAGVAQPPKTPTIAILLVGNREPFSTVFREGLRDLGYIDRQNVLLEVRSSEGTPELLPKLAEDLVRLGVDVIVASETPAVQAAKRATSDIPIVMAPSGDPVGTGLIASLARPGGNITGLSAATAELAGKSLELVREVLPSSRIAAALADPSNPFTKPFVEHVQAAGRVLGFEVKTVMVRGAGDFDAAFSAMAAERVDAVIVQPTLPRKQAIELALKHRLPSVSGNRAFADGGGLMSYSASIADRYRNAATYVDKILKGAKPADLPVQQPTKFELVVNLRTAKALGVTLPQSILLRADEVIE
jgi:putative ABC transport system substrate-binding protein